MRHSEKQKKHEKMIREKKCRQARWLGQFARRDNFEVVVTKRLLWETVKTTYKYIPSWQVMEG